MLRVNHLLLLMLHASDLRGILLPVYYYFVLRICTMFVMLHPENSNTVTIFFCLGCLARF